MVASLSIQSRFTRTEAGETSRATLVIAVLSDEGLTIAIDDNELAREIVSSSRRSYLSELTER
jgi:hypothetical protein